jgi:hypothetical protein
VNSSGTYHGLPGTGLGIAGSLTATSSILAVGTVFLSNSTIGGSYAVTGTTIVGGLVDFTGGLGPVTVIFNNLTINSGATLKGTDDLVLTGAFNWNNGTLEGVAGHGSLTRCRQSATVRGKRHSTGESNTASNTSTRVRCSFTS